MTVKDGRRWIGEALGSVLRQQGADFDVVVVDDGSTDGTPDLVRAAGDPRVRLVVHPRNLGVAAALRTGLAAASAPLVARMDADDVCEPGRLAAQVSHMAANPQCGVVGTKVVVIGEDGAPAASDYDPPHDETVIAWNLLLFTNPVCHPAVTFRREVVLRAGGYTDDAGHSEDRDLWTRVLPSARIQALPDRLLRYRQHAGSVSASKRGIQQKSSIAVRRRALAWLLGQDADTTAIERWYDDRMTARDADALISLFRRTFDALPATGRCTPEGLALVREDLARREESVRRRVRPGLIARVLRKFR